MASIKPIRPSIVESIDIWKKIIASVLKKPTEQQIKKMKSDVEMFKKVCVDD